MEKLENKDEENLKFKELEDMVFNFFNDLRFQDGAKVEDRVLEVSSEDSNEKEDNFSEEDLNEDDMNDIMIKDEVDNTKDLDIGKINKTLLADPNQIEEIDEEREDEDDHANEYEKKRLMYLDLEQKRGQYIRDLKKLGLKDEEID